MWGTFKTLVFFLLLNRGRDKICAHIRLFCKQNTTRNRYAAGKGGVIGMTLPMARDLARHGAYFVQPSNAVCYSPPSRSRLCLKCVLAFSFGFGNHVYDIVLNRFCKNQSHSTFSRRRFIRILTRRRVRVPRRTHCRFF